MLIYLLLAYICGCGGTGRRAGLRNQCKKTQINKKIEYADVAELVDALVLGTSTNGVGVQVPSSAPKKF